MEKKKYIIDEAIIQEVKGYLAEPRRMRLRRVTTDSVFPEYVSENYKLICHDPKTYLCPNTERISDEYLNNIAENCSESMLLDNQEQELVDYTIIHHDNIGSTVKVSPNKECFGHDESDDTLIASVIQETPIKEVSSYVNKLAPTELGFNDTLEEMNYLLESSKEAEAKSPVITEDKASTSRIPVMKVQSLSKVMKNENRRISPRFKTPVVPKSLSAKKKDFHHIESPVAALIHKSVKSPLIRKVNIEPTSSHLKKNEYSLPSNICYKPAARKQISVKENVKLPNNISKYMGKPTEIMQHKKVTPNLKRNLSDEDLTYRESLTSVNNDVSFITLRKHY